MGFFFFFFFFFFFKKKKKKKKKNITARTECRTDGERGGVMQRTQLATTVLVGMMSAVLLAGCNRKEPEQAAAPAAPEATAPAPAASAAYPTRVFFGDTHLHTALSLDAGAAGATLLPADAYRFAKGEEVTGASGQKAKLSRPARFPGRDRSLRPDGIRHRPQRRQAGAPRQSDGQALVRHDAGRGRTRSDDRTRHDLRAGQVPEGDHVQPRHDGIHRHLAGHHPGRRGRQRTRQVHRLHRLRMDLAGQRATTCTAT